GDGKAAAAEPDRAAPGAGGGEDGDGEADPGEPEPDRLGRAEGAEGLGDVGTEDLRRCDGHEEGEQGQAGRGDAAAADPRVELGEHRVHVLALLFGSRRTKL